MVNSKGEISIIRQLLKKSGVTKTSLRNKCNIESKYLNRYLAQLRSEGIVKLSMYGCITIVQLNQESPKFEAVKTLWGEGK